MQLLSLKHSIQ